MAKKYEIVSVPKNEIVVYQPNELVRLEVRVQDESVWLTQAQMCELFQRDVSFPNKVYKLPRCTATPPSGKTRFVGWACSNGKSYDDGVLVFNLAEPGETVTMTAIWE